MAQNVLYESCAVAVILSGASISATVPYTTGVTMQVQLKDLTLFADIQRGLDQLTPEDITAVTPGNPIPSGETVLGVMSPPLKALLALLQKSLRGDSEFTFPPIIFWEAVRAEFPETKHWRSFGYGPNFEIHHITESQINIDIF